MRRLIGSLLVSSLLAGGPGAALAHLRGAERLVAPPHQMFQTMLLYAGQAEFAKVEKSLDYVRPVLDELRLRFRADLGAGIRQAVAQRDRRATQAAILRLVFHDMRQDLEFVLQEGASQASLVDLRLAYFDYLLLAPHVENGRGRPAGSIARRFKTIYELMERSKPGARGVTAAIAEQIQAIERGCLEAFPEWGES